MRPEKVTREKNMKDIFYYSSGYQAYKNVEKEQNRLAAFD